MRSTVTFRLLANQTVSGSRKDGVHFAAAVHIGKSICHTEGVLFVCLTRTAMPYYQLRKCLAILAIFTNAKELTTKQS